MFYPIATFATLLKGGDGDKPSLMGVRGRGVFPSLRAHTAKAVMVQVGGVSGESLARNPTRGVQAASRFIQRAGCNSRKACSTLLAEGASDLVRGRIGSGHFRRASENGVL